MRASVAVGIIIKVAITAVALWIATLILPGIRLQSESVFANIAALIVISAIFGLVNAVLKPVIKTIGCGIYVLTLGLIALVVNGLLFLLVGWIAKEGGIPFEVVDFWPSAVVGAVIVGVVSFVLNLVVPDGKRDD